MSSPGTAFFIEPRGTLLDALRDHKVWLERTMPGQAFCGHPPHCTLLFGSYGSPVDWLEKLRRNVGELPAFELETDAWQEFPRDAVTGGGHTVAYRVRLTKPLALLQRTVADGLAPFISADADTHPLAGTEPFASSMRKFGFPFVGTHWIPHFTIGSPLVPPAAPILTQLMSGPTQHRFVVRSFSIWRVEGEHHEKLHELALSGGQI